MAASGLPAGVFAAADGTSSTHRYVFNRAESFSYSAANPVTAYFKLLVGPPPDDGNHAFTRNTFEVGFGMDNFEVSFIHRNDQTIEFSDGAREFAYRNKNNLSIPYDEYYDVDVWGNQYQASGVKLAYTWALTETLKMRAAGSALVGTEIVSGYLGKNPEGEGGSVAYTLREVGGQVRRVLDGNLHTDLYYTDDPFFMREVDEPTANGFSFDLGFEWRIRLDLTLSLQVDDLYGQLDWRDVPHTVADASGDMFEFDDDGALIATPSFDGVEDWGDYVQKLSRHERLFLDYRRGVHRWAYGYDRYSMKDFHRLQYRYVRPSGWGAKVSVEVTTGALALGWLMPVGELSIMLDDTRLDYATTVGLAWALEYRF